MPIRGAALFVLVLATLAAFAAPAAAGPAAGAPFLGPWAGVLEPGQSHTHVYDNNPGDQPCIDIVATYGLAVAYQPPSAQVTLELGDETIHADDGHAVETVEASYCASFEITVTAGADGPPVAYQLDVERLSV